ncbi:Protein of unknown function [Cotesia congregata]|uniref:Uncharacterized protein n=1 Tax=Cotesia congregata TaxID=51543 RepID=A0A8J2MM66_COTCN|nr:Protein of unknown function [Cotesia congregata]
MRFIGIILCCCCVFTGHFSNGSNIYYSSEIKTRLINHTMELINDVFKNNSNPVIITFDLVNDQVVSRNIDNGNPLIVVNGDLKLKQIEGYHPSYPTYVIEFESMHNLASLIFGFMRSTIWSLKSPIFILDISEGPHEGNADIIFRFFRKFDILVSYYLYVNKNYQNINFDKTQYLDGHKIKLLEYFGSSNLTEQRKQEMIYMNLKHVKDTKDLFLYSLPDYMKVTTSLHMVDGYFDNKQIKSGFDINLFGRDYDAYSRMYQLADTNYKLTDFVTQYREVHFSILTKNTNYLTVIREININLTFIFATIFVLLLILLMIIINNKFHVSQGIMDIVSMSLGMGIMSPIKRLSMKITYFFGFLFIFVVMPEFQGQISAVLSQPARRNVETLKDLFDNKYHVFYNGLLLNDIMNEKLWVNEEDQKYLHASTHLNLIKCAIEAQQNSTIACIEFIPYQLEHALKFKNLHVSKEIVFKKYFVFWTKKYWALKDKIDKARAIPVEIGLINHYDKEIKLWKQIKKREKIKEAENYERIDFENLVFYFIMFAAISLWSLIIFGIELIVHHIHSKYKRHEKERRQFIERLRGQTRIIFCPDRIVPSTSRE